MDVVTPRSCGVCNKVFPAITTEHQIREHMLQHVTISCNVCHMTFISNDDLAVHMEKHTGGKPFSCSICDKKFIEKPQIDVHMQTHTGEKPFRCDLCMESFPQYKPPMQTHLAQHHKPAGEVLYCSVCDLSFTCKSQRTNHLRTVHTSVHYSFTYDSCRICKKTFVHHLQKEKTPTMSTMWTKRRLNMRFLCSECEEHNRSSGEETDSCSSLKGLLWKPNADDPHNMQTVENCTTVDVGNHGNQTKDHVSDVTSVRLYRRPRFTCNDCKKSFELKSDFATHFLRTHVEGVDSSVQCNICIGCEKLCVYKETDHKKNSYFESKYLCEDCKSSMNRPIKIIPNSSQRKYYVKTSTSSSMGRSSVDVQENICPMDIMETNTKTSTASSMQRPVRKVVPNFCAMDTEENISTSQNMERPVIKVVQDFRPMETDAKIWVFSNLTSPDLPTKKTITESHHQLNSSGEPPVGNTVIKEVKAQKAQNTANKVSTAQETSPSFYCAICKRFYSKVNYFFKHNKRVHTHLKMCKICDQYFQESGSLVKHMYDHIRKYFCSICGVKIFMTCHVTFKEHTPLCCKCTCTGVACCLCHKVVKFFDLRFHLANHFGHKLSTLEMGQHGHPLKFDSKC